MKIGHFVAILSQEEYMEALSLLGIHTDGEHLVLVANSGERYLLPIEEELRSVVRQHRRKVATALEVKNPGSIRPREIQSMIRAGATAEEVSSAAGVDLEHVKRYEDPVLSERIWAWQQAGETRVSPDADAPELRDLVVDRLATRGVNPASLHWDATRQPGEEWVVHLEFVQDAKNYEANWEFDMDNRVLTALDEQSRWLTETATPAGSESLLRHSIFPSNADADSSGASGGAAGSGVTRSHPENTPDSQVLSSLDTKAEALLDELNAARGTRLTVVSGEEDDDISAMQAAIASGFREDSAAPGANTGTPTGAAVTSLISHQGTTRNSSKSATEAKSESQPATHEPEKNPAKTAIKTTNEPASLPAAAEQTPPDAAILPGMEQVAATESKSNQPKRSRAGRAQMPSWDEIMFGSKGE
ncbi:hypothetical protein HMPREF0580_1604 [Mobiluncus mulieris ATCC 35239]|uniref:DUF3071 domain-containing protein n=3 Tax=Mobiluncus mulieris TaxID=2052 RepID=E0QRT9_9ACTO|nr:septation protein SepH [Mobiluncus mulieris]EFM45797.1 hypothetical protein HMPREF0580_1604 [Mobiluncus mulieris ATCC 35239]MCU9970308.1 DUF3071 domain-containing protein [Mobiluncus mulieris]MCU9974771.1 DUF3071 domain-containing protein [Mobiluncus mulieris]MCU9994097.1 DUF3071 domain-containing protein [Mobiluncus mulieris]MCV0010655.1 DUF3071 domain-containing protein [Mobiluncus mulieris]